MIPLLSSSAIMSPPRFGFSEAARALRPTVSDIIWKLHRIIANPNSKLDEVRTARRRLLRLLKTSKFQEMIVPPLALRSSQQAERRLRQNGFIPRICASSVVTLSLERGEGAHPSVAERSRKLLSERSH